MKHVRINVRTLANAGAVRREKRNGRDVVIVPSATLPDGVVMNDIMYPADEIARSCRSLERTPAPLGHPTINGKFVSARDPEGINLGWIGAWNERIRQENGRVLLDKVIDVEIASQSPGGKAVLEAIDKGGPIHTSTGLLCNLEAANGEVPYKFVARNIEFDHDAILLDQEGAATPEQGVGMLVNSAGQPEEIPVINSALDEADEQMDWAVESVARALERRSRAGMLDRMKAAILEALGVPPITEDEEQPMTVSKEQFDALAAKVDSLAASVSKIPDTVSASVTNALKPVLDAQKAAADKAKADEEAEASGLVGKVVKANVLDEATAKATPLATLRALAKGAEPKKAAPLNAAFRRPVKAGAFALPDGD